MSLRPPKPSPLCPGYRLDRYELLCPIAQGGMASVWIARQLGKHGFEKLVAIKTILPEFAEDPRFQKMFLDEAHIASGIEHANVAQILDLGEEHGVLYLVMELVDGESLSRLHRALEKKHLALPLGIALRVLADACGGLHAAHELRDRDGAPLNVVHRDVSPQNILVSSKGAAKLIDFGVAKARDRLGGDSNSGMLKGKIHYMAPEQAVGKPIDRRADLWAIGAILYHLLSGRPPFDGPNQLATLHRLTSGRAPLPLPDSVPPVVVELIERALKHDAEQRVATAADMQAALESAMVEARVPTSTADVARFVREHLADRADARRKAIDVALAAAAERARVNKALELPDADSSSGFTKAPLSRAAEAPASPASASEPPPTVPGLPSNHRAESGTMASALIEHEPRAVDPRRRQRAVAIVATATAAAALLLVFVLGRNTAKPIARTVEPPAVTPFAAIPVASPSTEIGDSGAPAPTASPSPSMIAAAPSASPPKPSVKPAIKPTSKPVATATVKKPKVDDGF